MRHSSNPGSPQLSRRDLAKRLSVAGFSAPVIASILEGDILAQESTPEATPVLAHEPGADLREALDLDDRLIQYNPQNYGTPLDAVDGEFLVPNDLFFVRNHAPVPDIDAAEWRLSVSGLVDNSLELSLDDLKGMEVVTVTSFLECSGNSRSYFEPNASGTQWGNTAIGNAEWTGVQLSAVLEQAGVQDSAVSVVSQGADFEDMTHGLPIGAALSPDTMLVWEMNGEALPAVHGGPVRLLVPGWGGIASVKWITGMTVIDTVSDGQYNTESYVIIDEFETPIRRVREMPVKSVIASPVAAAELEPGAQTLFGYAWSGYSEVARVEVSTDGGTNWSDAEIVQEAGRLSWVKFEATWDAVSGQTSLYSRATDALATTQPFSVPWNAKGYQYNAVFEIPVTVR